MQEYRGYITDIKADSSNDRLIGKVLGTRALIKASGKTFPEVRQNLTEAIDEYIEICQQENLEPDKSYSGEICLQTLPDIHRAVEIVASLSGKSVSHWLEDLVVCTLETNHQDILGSRFSNRWLRYLNQFRLLFS
ncbi:MAG: type II toxin-antitoxin system HicB family antitoxin [Cyanobacteria bacterium P01_H01_bin.105]